MSWMFLIWVCVLAHSGEVGVCGERQAGVSHQRSLVWGPGLRADFWVPVRYFYIQLVGRDGANLTESVAEGTVTCQIAPASGVRVRIWTQVLDRHDGSYLVRYRLYTTTSDLVISVQLDKHHLAQSPYHVKEVVFPETCYCPHKSADDWARSAGCPSSYPQIERDLQIFHSIDMATVAKEAVLRFNQRASRSLCHFKVIKNKVYRRCYGEHVGFKMFPDAVLLSLTRKMQLPDLEFIMNLGDWPLVKMAGRDKPIPVMSWCGSNSSHDIVMPTYDITEATLQMMGRISLDMFSTQANTGPRWEHKIPVAFWRGRDSRKERLQLAEMSLANPDLLDARLTNMFFFPKDEAKYGPLTPQISFFKFFQYKYQLNIDGTVAAYRLPYLLAGDSVVLKQDSEYYEHFYTLIKPYVHYIPVRADLTDLLDKIRWARTHDDQVKQIAKNGQAFAREHLTPAEVLCYHVRLFQAYAARLSKKPKGVRDFEKVDQPVESRDCGCPADSDRVQVIL